MTRACAACAAGEITEYADCSAMDESCTGIGPGFECDCGDGHDYDHDHGHDRGECLNDRHSSGFSSP